MLLNYAQMCIIQRRKKIFKERKDELLTIVFQSSTVDNNKITINTESRKKGGKENNY